MKSLSQALMETKEIEPRFYWRLRYLDGAFVVKLAEAMNKLADEKEKNLLRKKCLNSV